MIDMVDLCSRIEHNDVPGFYHLEKMDVNFNSNINSDGDNILFSKNLEPVITLFLIKKGAKVNKLNDKKRTAIFYQSSSDVINILIDNGAKINIQDIDGKTPLFFVKNKESAQILIENGLDINILDKKGKNAAFYITDLDTLKYLKEQGIRLDIISNDGETPLFNSSLFAYKDGFKNNLSRNENYNIIKFFLENGVNVNQLDKSSYSFTSKFLARMLEQTNSREFFQLLHKYNVDVAHVTSPQYGTTLLYFISKASDYRNVFSGSKPINLNKLKVDGSPLYSDLMYSYELPTLYEYGFLEKETLFTAEKEGNISVGDAIITFLEERKEPKTKEFIALKEKYLIFNAIEEAPEEIKNKHRI